MKTREMCRTALMTALLCMAAPLTVPVGPVPLSLATLAVYLAGALLGVRGGMTVVGLYLLIGAMGVPVFSGFSAGIPKIVGPTGGYMLGYLACAATVGYFVERWGRKRWIYPISMALGTVLCYAMGTGWFMLQTGVNIAGALASCILPFLPGDIMKIIAATVICSFMKQSRIP